jgi:hypothetical protein
MLDHFYNGVEIADKKSILRQLKTMWILLNPVSPIADLVQTKKLKQTYEQCPKLEVKDLHQINQKIVEVTIRNAFKYHKSQTLESLQTAKIICELLALFMASQEY